MRPLEGIRVIEMAGLAPSPYCGMLLADFGADVIVIDRLSKGRPEIPNQMEKNPLDRGKRFVRIDLKRAEGISLLKSLIPAFDVLLEPYRPGVMEKLGIGPAEALRVNPRLVYARLTGWGQSGPYSRMAGHDINYLALVGALSLFRRKGGSPFPPCNFLGDFAGGGMLCALGILLALMERNRSGLGQVVDSAMVDGVTSLGSFFYGLLAHHLMTLDIGTNMLDGGAPYYQAYETADGKYMAVGAVEGRFYAQLLKGLGLDPSTLPGQNEKEEWPEMRARFAREFKLKSRDEWTAIFDELEDACVVPVLEMNEVADHRHNRAREILIEVDGVCQPAPAPRLSRTPGEVLKRQSSARVRTKEVLSELGLANSDIDDLLARGIVESE